MNSKSIVFFDIDGTLYNSEKELPDSTKESIASLKEDGHIVAIATGRAPFMYEDLRKELGIDTFVSLNGQYVVVEDEVIYTNPMDKHNLEEITLAANANDHPVVHLDHEDMLADMPEHDYVTEGISTLKLGRMPGHDPNYHVNRDIYQTLLFCPENEEQQYYEEFGQKFKFIRWHPVSMDVTPKTGSKAEGIGKVIDKLGVADDRQFAFGDGMNDIEMLQSIHNSYAMGNAHDVVKKAAKHVTKNVEEDGIYHGLKMAGLIR